MVYLKSVENVITLGKLIGLLFLFSLPLLSILFLKTKRNDLARPVMGTIFLVDIRIIITTYLLNDCLSRLNLIGQLEGNISPYCLLSIARAYSDVEVMQ